MTREEAREALSVLKIYDAQWLREAVDMAIEALEHEQKTGHWIYHPEWEEEGGCGYECSVCNMGSDVDYSFCMRCGAEMRGKQNE